MTALQVEDDCQRQYLDQPRSPDEAAALTIQMIDLLLAAGADINRAATLDETALHTAASWSSPAVIRHRIACGANPNAHDSDYTPHSPAENAKRAKRWEAAAILREAMDSRS
jgi:ankyrin repeat protein